MKWVKTFQAQLFGFKTISKLILVRQFNIYLTTACVVFGSLVSVEEGENKDSVKTAILQIPSLPVSLDSFILALILTRMQLGERTFGKRR